MNTTQELLKNGLDKTTAINMLDNYTDRIGLEYGCWKLIDINYDFECKCQMWTFKCLLCGTIKTVKKPKLRDVSITCSCQKNKKIKKEPAKIIRNNDISYLDLQYGNDKVIGFKKNSKGSYEWVCECQLCGNTHLRTPSELKSGNVPLCKCQCDRPRTYETLIGKKENFLKVIDVDRSQKGHPYLICQCDCGNTHRVQPHDWKNDIVKSCGCKHNELLSTHGLSKERLYRIWNGMNQRCYNTNDHAYGCYGGRGIMICDEWLGNDGLLRFIEWARRNGYSDDLSIDRIDVNGNYEPSNCRWADAKTQLENRRPSSEWKKRKKGQKKKRRVVWTIKGTEKPARDWCEDYGISYETVMYRVKQKGMSILEALTAPKMTDGRPREGV